MITAALAAYVTFSVAHAALVARTLKNHGAPWFAYALVPIWLFTWPFKSLSAVWFSSCVKPLDSSER